MLTKTIEEVFEIVMKHGVIFSKVLIATLENQRDDRFHEEMEFLNRSLTRAPNELECHRWQRSVILYEMERSKEQPLYTTHQFLLKGNVENWIVTKMQVLNSLLYYNGLRIKQLESK